MRFLDKALGSKQAEHSSVPIFQRVKRADALFSDCNYTGFAAFIRFHLVI